MTAAKALHWRTLRPPTQCHGHSCRRSGITPSLACRAVLGAAVAACLLLHARLRAGFAGQPPQAGPPAALLDPQYFVARLEEAASRLPRGQHAAALRTAALRLLHGVPRRRPGAAARTDAEPGSSAGSSSGARSSNSANAGSDVLVNDSSRASSSAGLHSADNIAGSSLARARPGSRVQAQGGSGDNAQFEAGVAALQAVLAALPGARGASVPCALDPGLASALPSGKLLVALNLHDSEDVAPHQVAQLVQLAALLPAGRVAVSVYESGSADGTRAWLRLLQGLLAQLGAPARIILDGGEVTRDDGEARMVRLARIRNAALAPLWEASPGGQSGDAGGVDQAEGGGAAGGGFAAERVVFVNDVFFCVGDVLRLLAHDQADIACGLDFKAAWPGGLKFYDTWVARDAGGAKFSHGTPPYARDAYAVVRGRQGLPFPVSCCWNGMAVLRAAPFRQAGVRFRGDDPGNCPASECSFICDDFIRAGYTRFVVDPGVRLAYSADTARQLAASPERQPNGQALMPLTSWAQVQAAPIDEARWPRRFANACCQHVARLFIFCQRQLIHAPDDQAVPWWQQPFRILRVPASLAR